MTGVTFRGTGPAVQVEEMFGGNQEGTLAQVKAKRVEAGAVNSRFLAQYAEREHVQFREIYVSEGFPDLAVIAHPRVPAATVERVRARPARHEPPTPPRRRS